ncbi:MAG: hypothetical protein V4787_09445 [Pseudomonadota bacterium]
MDTNVQVPWYSRSLDFAKLARDYPPPPDYFNTHFRMPRAEMRALQEERFKSTMQRAWEIPFYQRHWKEAGLEPGDIRGLDDIRKIPTYDVHDIRKSIERNPPFGDFMGISPADGHRLPMVLQTSGGTTGLPRPMLYSPQDRETMAILGARRMFLHGIRPGDLVLLTYSFNLSNGGFGPREQLWGYTGAIPVTTGSGSGTPTRRQVEIIQAWKINVILGFAPYLRHMGVIARDEMGIDPKTLGVRLIGTHGTPEERAHVEELWGAPTFDAYGAHDSGMMAAECEAHDGLHVSDDAFWMEILDPETGEAREEGTPGALHVTTLYKYGAPQVRFNTNDITRNLPWAPCTCGGMTTKLDRPLGRADNMIKLRGVNVFPEAVGATIAQDARSNGEFFCVVDRDAETGRDTMEAWVEMEPGQDHAAVTADLEQRLKESVGVRIRVVPKEKGELDPFTGTSRNSKIKRLLDRRPKT